MPGTALILLAVYGLVAFVLRDVLQRRRTGASGIVGLSGAPGSREWLAGALFVVAIAVTVLGPVLELSGTVRPLVGAFPVHAVGAALVVAGTVGTFLAQLAMGASWRVGVDESERTDLVADGLFAIVRNPIYSAMIPTFAGVALMASNVITLAGAVAMFAALELQTRLVEEPHLLRTHGSDYVDYASRVGRFVPGVGRLRR